MQYAPHYREDLLRELGKQFDLTVSCVPCSEYSLIPPAHREGYVYFLPKGKRFGDFWFLKEDLTIFRKPRWDAVISVEDMHHPLRYVWYAIWLITGGRKKGRWIWWGHFSGRRQWFVLRWLRRWLVNSSSGALTYSEAMRASLIAMGCRPEKVMSSNNTVVCERDFSISPVPKMDGSARLLYVGRNQPRKALRRLVELAARRPEVRVRIIGPLATDLRKDVDELGLREQVECLDPIVGEALAKHFSWCHCVVAPGHLGLLVTDAARFGRPILVDSSSDHAPEASIAEEAGQPFFDWSSRRVVDSYVDTLLGGRVDLQNLADQLSDMVKMNYTIEEMARRFARMIKP